MGEMRPTPLPRGVPSGVALRVALMPEWVLLATGATPWGTSWVDVFGPH